MFSLIPDVLMQPQPFMEHSNIEHTWIRASKTSIRVKWDNAENMNFVDGVLILRQTGKKRSSKKSED